MEKDTTIIRDYIRDHLRVTVETDNKAVTVKLWIKNEDPDKSGIMVASDTDTVGESED